MLLFRGLILSIVLVYLLGSCHPAQPPQRAFYHWETQVQLTKSEQTWLDQCGVTRLYTRFFDVDWSAEQGQIAPLASVQLDTHRLGQLELVPVVFITNRTWDHVESAVQVQQLSASVRKKIWTLAQALGSKSVKEVQIDCDWTASSRRVYFAFLEQLRHDLRAQNCALSATIRLHQCKYLSRTGVPPVDRGMLMLYNVGNLEDWSADNSIFSLPTAEAYAPLPPYPIPLDLVLPAFSWGVLFREKEAIRLLNDLRVEDLRRDPRFREIAPRRFRVQKSTYLEGHYLYAGDLLRIETCGSAELLAAARFAQRQPAMRHPSWVAIYHLHPRLIKALSHEVLEDVFTVF